MAEDTETTTTGEASPADSTPASTLTSEDRDTQTIERLLGPTPKPEPAATTAETTEDADAEAASEESEKPAEGAATTEADDADTDAPGLTDEDIETVLDAIGEDELLANPRLAAKLDARIKAELDRRSVEQEQQATLSKEQDELLTQGRTAVQTVYDAFGKATEQLAKIQTQLKEAVAGRDFTDIDIDAVLSPDALKSALGTYGQAVVIEAGRSMNDNFMQAFREGAGLIGADQFTDADGERLKKILQTADRILKDEKQGRVPANRHFFTETMKFLVERALETGRAKAVAEVQKRRDALKKIVGDGGENTTRAAVAKVAKARSKTPPASPAAGASTEAGPASMERYRQLKKEGKYDEADAVIQQLQQ